MVYWVTCEAPTTIISICLPPMANLVRRFYSTFLLPLSGKFSSLISSRPSRDSSFKSRGSACEAGHETANDNSKEHLRLSSNGSNHSFIDSRRSLRSTESRNQLVPNTANPPARVYVEGCELSHIAPRQEQYVASRGGAGLERFGNREKKPNRQIQVSQHISVNHQARRP